MYLVTELKVYCTSVQTQDENANEKENPERIIDVAWTIGWGDVIEKGCHVV
jgi:hypothetical protein